MTAKKKADKLELKLGKSRRNLTNSTDILRGPVKGKKSYNPQSLHY